jgi:arylsulfatase A-like enzyme
MRDSLRLTGQAVVLGASLGALLGVVDAVALIRTDVLELAAPSAPLVHIGTTAAFYAAFGCALALAVVLLAAALRRTPLRVRPAATLAAVPALLVFYRICALAHYDLERPLRSGGFLLGLGAAALLAAVVWRALRALGARAAGTRLRHVSRPLLLFGAPVVLLVVAASLLSSTAPAQVPAAGRRSNLVLLTLDTLRADRVGAYGHAAARTPNLDRLAAAGALFRHAYTPVVVTGPAHAALLTSTHPVEHRLLSNGRHVRPEVPTLAEALAAAGYRTFAGVGVVHLDGTQSGLDRGFERFSNTGRLNPFMPLPLLRTVQAVLSGLRGPSLWTPFRAGSLAVDEFTRWLARNARHPFFAWIHLFDPHSPYGGPEARDVSLEAAFRAALQGSSVAPDDPRIGRLSALYDDGVASADRQVGRVLAALAEHDLAANTLVIAASDHGETFADPRVDQGFWFNHRDVYEDTARVVLAMSQPSRIPRGLVVEEPVSLLDVAPTALSLLGVENGRHRFRGVDLAPRLAGRGTAPADRCLVVQHAPNTPGLDSWAVRKGCSKLVLRSSNGPAELYDLCADPGESTDLAAKQPQAVSDLTACFRSERRFFAAAGAPPPAPLVEQLRSLGY